MFDSIAHRLVDDLFNTFGEQATLLRLNGGQDTIRAVVNEPTAMQRFSITPISTEPEQIDISLDESLAPPAKGDVIKLKRGSFTIKGTPTRDDISSHWACGCSKVTI